MSTAAHVAGYWSLISRNVPGPFLAAGSQPTLTGVVIDVYPPRVSLGVTGLTPGNTVTIYRRVAGSPVRTPVRGADDVVVTSDGLLVTDAEQPFGVLLGYQLVVDGADIGPEIMLQTDVEMVALSDAISGNAVEVAIIAWPEQARTRNSSVFQVGGRNIVVAGERGQFSSSIEFFTETETGRQAMLTLLDNATSGIVQVRQPGGYYGTDAYLAVLSDVEQRWSQDGSDEKRRWVLDVAEVGPWSSSLTVSEFTYQDVADAYEGLTYADLADDYSSYLTLGQGDFQ